MTDTATGNIFDAAGALDPAAVAALGEEARADRTRGVVRNAIAATSVNTVALDRAVVTGMDHSVSHRVDGWAAANQKRSGRCWIFAGLNSLRGPVMAETGIEDLEFSQAYVHYWDKLEKANHFLCAMAELADRPLDDRTVEHLLTMPIDDGGQWNMFVALVEKYGVVPKYAMPETFSSSCTESMNRDLETVLRRAALRVRAGIEGAREDALADVHRILEIHLGTPPERFVWQYRTKEGRFHRGGEMTPLQFAERYLPRDLGEYVCVVNDPRNDYGKLYTVEYLGNVVGGAPVTYLNAPMDVLRDAARDTIVAGRAVWFGCDTEVQCDADLGYWDEHLHDYEGVYGVDMGMSKRTRLEAAESLMTHAMVLVGADVADDAHTVNRWRVENSWGTDTADRGFWTMNDNWFGEYVFEIAVHPRALPQEYRDALGGDVTVLPAWDPMGALA